jgi:poly(3-hydroxyalkanoate) synthetase
VRSFLIDGNAVDASQITCPVLVLAHTGDVLAPPDSAHALLEVVSSADREAGLMVLIGVGRSGADRIQPRRLLLAVDAGT